MVVFDADVFGALLAPDESDAPLQVDADGVLAFAISVQRVQTIGWREAESFESGGSSKFAEFAKRSILNLDRQLARRLAIPDFLGILVGETLNHISSVTYLRFSSIGCESSGCAVCTKESHAQGAKPTSLGGAALISQPLFFLSCASAARLKRQHELRHGLLPSGSESANEGNDP